MKLSILVLMLLLSTASFAQTLETYDIATFTPPSGWRKQTKEGAVLFADADEKKGTFGMLTIYASGVSSGDPKRDFESDWQEFIAGQLKVTARPDMYGVFSFFRNGEKRKTYSYSAINANGELVP